MKSQINFILVVSSQLYLWPNVTISSVYLKYSLNDNSVNFAKIFWLIHSPFFTSLSYRIKKRKKTMTFKLIKLLKQTQKHAVTTKDKILIRHYRLDKSIEPEIMPPNNPGLNPTDYSILEILPPRLYNMINN